MRKVVNKKSFFFFYWSLDWTAYKKRNKEKNIQTGSLEGEIAV